ncbi:hypothetical protein ACJX0J_024038, partial [Zea mays]
MNTNEDSTSQHKYKIKFTFYNCGRDGHKPNNKEKKELRLDLILTMHFVPHNSVNSKFEFKNKNTCGRYISNHGMEYIQIFSTCSISTSHYLDFH